MEICIRWGIVIHPIVALYHKVLMFIISTAVPPRSRQAEQSLKRSTFHLATLNTSHLWLLGVQIPYVQCDCRDWKCKPECFCGQGWNGLRASSRLEWWIWLCTEEGAFGNVLRRVGGHGLIFCVRKDLLWNCSISRGHSGEHFCDVLKHVH